MSLWEVGAEQGPRGSEMEADGAPSRSRCLSCLLVGVPLAATLVLDPESEHSPDVILVGSSELSSPPSPGPHRGEGSFEYWAHHLGCQL